MKTHKTSISTLALMVSLAVAPLIWSGAAQSQDQAQIYGSQLMTDVERIEYQSKMRSLKTDKERDAFRSEHHEKMKVLAAEKGVTLPAVPPAVGAGNKFNSGAGAGSNSGLGAGQGAPTNPSTGGGKGYGRLLGGEAIEYVQWLLYESMKCNSIATNDGRT